LVIVAGDQEDLELETVQILNALRTQSAPYLQNAMLHRKVKDLAALDDLTMILNRRFGLRRLQEEFSRSVRHGVPVSVLMIDIDHFKTFNDTFGHDAGDAVLRRISETLESNLRSGDVICRYGGEEFLVVAPGTGLNDAAVLADRLRRIIETDQVAWGNQTLAVTVSIGMATWPIERASISEELITAADKALYHAKDRGRNCIAMARGEEILSMDKLEEERTQTLNPAV
jgi:diguanylate cyclase (GGDEF)-like protein